MTPLRLSGAALAALLIAAAPVFGAPPTPSRLADPAIGDQDDMCVWVHPTDAAKSTIVTSDKKANRLFVYDLDGKTIQSLVVKHPGNIDSRSGFPLGGGKVDIVAVNLRDEKLLAVFKVDPDSRKLTRIDDGTIATGENYGGCLYHSGKTGKFFAVVTSKSGVVTQYELTDDGTGKAQGKKVRTWKVGGVCEGAVADDYTGKVYIAEEHAGVWELGGEPTDDAPGSLVVKVGENDLKGDVEGLAIFARPDGTGYLLVSDQGASRVRVYRREQKHEYVGAFALVGMGEQDGIEVVSIGLGAKYPNGLFLCHTGSTTPCPVLTVPWNEIAKTFTPPLMPVKAGPPKDAPLELKQTIPFPGKTGNLDHLAVDTKGGRVFVANKPNNTLDVIDLNTGKLIKQIPDQGKASGVAYAEDLGRIFVGNGSGTCNSFDSADYKLAFSAKIPKADNVNYHAATKQLYVAHGTTITALDAKSGEVRATVALPGDAHGFAIDEKGNKLYVSLTTPSQIGVVDLSKHEVVDKFPLTLATGNSPVAFDAAHGLLFVGCRKEPTVVILDAKTGKELGSVAIPADIDDLLFDAKSGRAFAICGAGSVAVIQKIGNRYEAVQVDTAKGARTATLAPAGDRIFVGVPMQSVQSQPEVRIFAIKQ